MQIWRKQLKIGASGEQKKETVVNVLSEQITNEWIKKLTDPNDNLAPVADVSLVPKVDLVDNLP